MWCALNILPSQSTRAFSVDCQSSTTRKNHRSNRSFSPLLRPRRRSAVGPDAPGDTAAGCRSFCQRTTHRLGPPGPVPIGRDRTRAMMDRRRQLNCCGLIVSWSARQRTALALSYRRVLRANGVRQPINFWRAVAKARPKLNGKQQALDCNALIGMTVSGLRVLGRLTQINLN